MSTRKDSAKTRAYRPATDALEGRQLLSGIVSGTDIDGDTWTVRLIGQGSISVVKQNGADGNPSPLTSSTEINAITIAGTDPKASRVVGSVTKGASGDGRVFFQSLSELPGRSLTFPSTGQGLLSIDMPGFWLANTTPSTSTTTATSPSIKLPDGVETLTFGGVDTTHNQPVTTANSASDTANVTLGLPAYGGTRIVIDRSISSTQSAPGTVTSTDPTPAARIIQHGVVFSVGGRLQAFQANSIDGDAANPPGQFTNQLSTATGVGGTTVFSSSAGSAPYFPTVDGIKGAGIGGQIGFLNVGGNATNFTTVVDDPSLGGVDKVSNFYIGGETKNVLLVAPSGARNVVFGKGMDTVEIRTHVINTLKANRGAVNSNVVVDRTISSVDIGGDVVDTNILTGANQSFTGILSTISGATSGAPAAPPLPTNAETGGGMFVHVAGDVVDSVFAASVEPFNGVYGGRNQIVLPSGHIKAKLEGTVNNSTATPDNPTKAFYAAKVELTNAPVAPAGVPEAPFVKSPLPYHLPGVHGSGINTAGQVKKASSVHAAATATAAAHRVSAATVGKVTPKGPRAK